MFPFRKNFEIQSKCNYYGAKELALQVKRKGESFSFGIEEGQIEDFLLEKGFSLISHYTPSQFENKYLNNNGSFFGKMYGFACHAHAMIKTEG